MTRRKSDFKRTLVLVVFLCPFVFSRPQESLTTSISYAETTESPLRYRFRVDSSRSLDRVHKSGNFYNTSFLQYIASFLIDQFPGGNQTNRINRLLRKSFKTEQNPTTPRKIKPVIKKVITKWTDNVKDDNLEFSREDEDIKSDSIFHNYYTSTEINNDINTRISDKRYSQNNYPHSQYSEETHIYSSNFQVIDKHPYASPTRPSFIYSKPTPTPIITNVGYPPSWHDRFHNTKKPSTVKPIKYTKPPYNSYPNYPNIFEVTTFPPTTGYTDRIVIRPEEYAAISDDCPTIFLTLNNTFQGQGKEACPDLNIAVNTNVVNKNVVVESEEDTDSTLTDIFGLPDGNSESEESSNNYSDENEEDESAAIESLELSNYNAANDAIQAESAESANFAQQSSPVSALSRPTKDDEDDVFGLSSIISFFRPAISAFSWLASINPLSFPALSFILTPVLLLVASTYGVAALFAPWVLTYARKAPDIGFYAPQSRWIDNYETWNSNAAYNNWKQRRILSRSKNLNIQSNVTRNRQTWFSKLKQWMTTVTEILNNRKQSVKRKKRNIITYYKK
ncbi:uncharacterized protein LOC123714707 [Pieris brassicae]|uniref:uncharacterized protein LOC123714707 n=1 Tax=Pieris brassicae TaxID=7116 RepID=UPI001E660255|nr:uncharacterized protein LOC123714707 [Pieris brassicae]